MDCWGSSGQRSGVERPRVRASGKVDCFLGKGDEASLQKMSCCRICQSQMGSVHYAKERLIGLPEEFRYFQCLECGCLQLDQDVEDMARFYASGYGTIHASPVKQMLRYVMYYFSYSPSEL